MATTVSLNTSLGGTADYTTGNSSANVTLAESTPNIRINAGRTSPVNFAIFPTSDALTEGDETLIITLLLGDGYTLGSANSDTLTITNVP